MRLSRRPRGRIAAFLILALLALQLATAVHACVRDAGRMPPCPACPAHARTAAIGDEASLCKAHCEQGRLTVNQAGHAAMPEVAPLPPLWAVLDWKPLAAAAAPALLRPGTLRSGAPPPGAPPIYLDLLVLRR